jgi:hypothetical protein
VLRSALRSVPAPRARSAAPRRARSVDCPCDKPSPSRHDD